MSHEQLQEQIPAYVAARLSEAELAVMDSHLDGCEDCTDLVRVGMDLAQGLREAQDEVLSPHPGIGTLRAYSLGEEVAERAAVVRHVASCASCELEVAAWRRWTKMNPTNSHEDEMRVARDRKSYWRPALAAGLLLGLGLTLAVQQLLPEATSPAVGSPAPWTGSAALFTLEQPLRGAAPAAQVVLDPGQPYLPLAVFPALPEDLADADVLRFAIAAGTEAAAVWSLELTADRVRAQQESTGVVTFLVPTDNLQSGRARFSMRDAQGASLLEIPFEVQRQSPAATNPPQ